MLGLAWTLPTATASPAAKRLVPVPRAVALWRLMATLLVLLLGVAVAQALTGAHSAPLTARHVGPTSRKEAWGLPLAGVSGALGRNDRAYAVRRSAGGLQAVSAAQSMHVRFERSEVLVGSGDVRLGLHLRAVGYGAPLTAVEDVTPRGRANRIVYTHARLSEWYVNGPLGLEQGFTIPRPLDGHLKAPLTLAMDLSSNAHATLAASGHSLTLSHARASLRYGGLIAKDALGRTLRSWLELHPGRVLLRVDTRGARYPLRIDPLIQQGSKLTGSGETGGAIFGVSVALSSDGNTALVGGSFDNNGIGAAWVFTRSAGKWTQQGAKLTGSGELGQAAFGTSVALSSDGNTALIGGEEDNGVTGAAWVFTRSVGKWTQQGTKLAGGEESGSGRFGRSVALSSDGNTAVIGGIWDNGGAGAAWVFTRSGVTWTQQGPKLTGSEEIGSGGFGSAVALSSDGNTALVGGNGDKSSVGAAWVFTRSGVTWSQQGSKLTGSGEIGEGLFGFSVALSSDGNTALIGGQNDNGIPNNIGAAWAFTRSGTTWTQQGSKLTGGGEVGGAAFGLSVALSSDGNTALVGGYYDNKVAGAAWVFKRSGFTWTQQGQKLTAKGEIGEGRFGYDVALAANGETGLIGGTSDNGNMGAAWAFVSLDELAYLLRPNFYFDNSEQWRPLNVESFLSEANKSHEALNQVCDGSGTCYPLTGPESLNNTPTSGSFIDIAGNYKTEGTQSYHSPTKACVKGGLLDCNSGSASAFYYHLEGPNEGYSYIDYWLFYRFNYFAEALPEGVSGNHEGDWESVSLAPASTGATFDFASFSQHGTWYSYLRQVMSCDGKNRGANEEVHKSGTCGSETAPTGARVSVFPANGDHANYPEECSESFFGSCTQTTADLPERGHDGSKKWGSDTSSSALLKLPEPGAGSWVDWPGVWGKEADASPETPPMSPGNQQPHFAEPWRSSCITREETGKCALTASVRGALHHSTSLAARSQLVPLAGATNVPDAHGKALGADKYCANWFGGGVQALLCTPTTLARALETRALTPAKELGFLSRPGSQVAAAPGVAQAVGPALRPGQTLMLHGAVSPETVLLVRVRNGKQLLDARFTKLAIGRGQIGTIRASRVGRAPAIEVVGPRGQVERPSTIIRRTAL